MIYSKFGTLLSPVSTQAHDAGTISMQDTADGATDIREYRIDDLKADDGMTEINEVLAMLPWKVMPKKAQRRMPL